MIQIKKIIAWWLVLSLFLSYFDISFASNETQKISPDEIKKVETEIIQLQKKLSESGKTYVEKFSQDLDTLMNYEESWNSKIEIHADEENFWKWNMSLKLNHYSIKNARLDTSLSADIDMKADYSPVYGSGFSLNLKTFASFINKNWELYALLKDFDFTINDANISQIADEVKKQFADNKYIKLPSDENTQLALNMIKNFDIKNVFTESDTILSQPLFTPYKKSGDKYLLVPSKYACDTYFELDKKFNFSNPWYTPQTCTQWAYQKFVEKFTQDVEIYLVFGKDENTFWLYSQNTDATVDFTLKYNNTKITKIDLSIIPEQIKFKNEWMSMNYKNGEFLKANLYAEKWLYKMNFYSELDEKNHFVEIDGNINLNKDIIGNITLKNNKINSFLLMKEQWYENNAYRLKNVFALKTTGNFDTNNQLQNMNMKFAWIHMSDKKVFFLWKFWYNAGNFNVYAKYDDMMWKIVFNGKWKIKNKYFQFDTDFDFNNMYTGKMNLEVDVRDNKNNANILFLLNNWGKEVLKMTLVNEAKREYKNNIIIEAPKDFKEINTSQFINNNWGQWEIFDENSLDSIKELQ